jgi:RimJ/RimL family protein N-acetyltransferase
MNGRPITSRRLIQTDAPALIALRLEVAALDEAAMGASFAEENARPIQSFLDQLDPNGPSALFGAFVGSELVAAAGVHQSSRLPSSAHKSALWGVVVSPTRRQRGFGRMVVSAALSHAFAIGVRRVNLAVYVPNEAAIRLYSSMGFEQYGTEPQALFLDGRFYDSQLMSKAHAA